MPSGSPATTARSNWVCSRRGPCSHRATPRRAMRSLPGSPSDPGPGPVRPLHGGAAMVDNVDQSVRRCTPLWRTGRADNTISCSSRQRCPERAKPGTTSYFRTLAPERLVWRTSSSTDPIDLPAGPRRSSTTAQAGPWRRTLRSALQDQHPRRRPLVPFILHWPRVSMGVVVIGVAGPVVPSPTSPDLVRASVERPDERNGTLCRWTGRAWSRFTARRARTGGQLLEMAGHRGTTRNWRS